MKQFHLQKLSVLVLFAFSAQAEVVALESLKPTEKEIAAELVQLETSGWRLTDPSDKCLEQSLFKYVRPGRFGNTEAPDRPVVEIKKGETVKITSVARDPSDSSVWKVRFKVGNRSEDGFTFSKNRKGIKTQGHGTILNPSNYVYVREECKS